MMSRKSFARPRLAAVSTITGVSRVALVSTIALLALGAADHAPAFAAADSAATATPSVRVGTRSKDHVVARVWTARTPSSKADAYFAYLSEKGAQPLRAADGNLGVQVFRRGIQDTTEFTLISYWTTSEALLRAASQALDEARPLPRDAEFLLPPGGTGQNHAVWLNDIGKLASRPGSSKR